MSAWLDVRERTAISEARRRAKAMAVGLGFDANDQERAAIIVTEAATNIVRYAETGQILLARSDTEDRRTLSIIAADDGPGIRNLDRMMEDGISTSDSQGTGLGAMRRMADTFDIQTTPGNGTTIAMEIVADQSASSAVRGLSLAGLRLCYPGLSVCGDAWSVRRRSERTELFVCDGLGHGPKAADAADAAVASFQSLKKEEAPTEAVVAISAAVADTRGAVALFISVDETDDVLTYAGVGNVSGSIVKKGSVVRLVSRDGRLGARHPRPIAYEQPFGVDDVLILHSDGLRALKTLGDEPTLMRRSPLLIAATLLRRNARGTDDACILVAKRSATAID